MVVAAAVVLHFLVLQLFRRHLLEVEVVVLADVTHHRFCLNPNEEEEEEEEEEEGVVLRCLALQLCRHPLEVEVVVLPRLAYQLFRLMEVVVVVRQGLALHLLEAVVEGVGCRLESEVVVEGVQGSWYNQLKFHH